MHLFCYFFFFIIFCLFFYVVRESSLITCKKRKKEVFFNQISGPYYICIVEWNVSICACIGCRCCCCFLQLLLLLLLLLLYQLVNDVCINGPNQNWPIDQAKHQQPTINGKNQPKKKKNEIISSAFFFFVFFFLLLLPHISFPTPIFYRFFFVFYRKFKKNCIRIKKKEVRIKTPFFLVWAKRKNRKKSNF